jgi:hypothetical protein
MLRKHRVLRELLQETQNDLLRQCRVPMRKERRKEDSETFEGGQTALKK